ncbi:hypothetical protein M513_10873, partial [Trichuris suis]
MQFNWMFFLLLLYGIHVCLGATIPNLQDECKDGREEVNGTIWYKCVNRRYREVGCYFLDQKFLYNTTINDGSAEYMCNVTAANKTVVSITACLLSGFRLELGRGFPKENFYYTCAVRNMTVYHRITACADDEGSVIPFGSAFSTEHFLLQCMRIKEHDVYVRVMACAVGTNPVYFGQNSTDDQFWYSCSENGEEVVKEIKGCFHQNTRYQPGGTYMKDAVSHVCRLPVPSRWVRRNRKQKMISNYGYTLPPVHHFVETEGKEGLTAASDRNLLAPNDTSSNRTGVYYPGSGLPSDNPSIRGTEHLRPYPSKDCDRYLLQPLPVPKQDAETQTPRNGVNQHGCRNPDDPSYNLIVESPGSRETINGIREPITKQGLESQTSWSGYNERDNTGYLKIVESPNSVSSNTIFHETVLKKPCRYGNFGNMDYNAIYDSNNLVQYQQTSTPSTPNADRKCKLPNIEKENYPLPNKVVDSILTKYSIRSPTPCYSLQGLCARLNELPSGFPEQPHCPVILAGKTYRFLPGFGLRFKGEMLLCEIDTKGNAELFTYGTVDCHKEPKADWNVVQVVKASTSKNLVKPSNPKPCNSLEDPCVQYHEIPLELHEEPHCQVMVFGKEYRFNPGFGMRFKGELFLCVKSSTGMVSLFTYRTADCSREPNGDWKVLKVVV